MKFYFTYGTDGQPFVGGWTEVEAPTELQHLHFGRFTPTRPKDC